MPAIAPYESNVVCNLWYWHLYSSSEWSGYRLGKATGLAWVTWRARDKDKLEPGLLQLHAPMWAWAFQPSEFCISIGPSLYTCKYNPENPTAAIKTRHGSCKMFLAWPTRPGTSLSNVPLSKPVRSSPGQKGVPGQQGAQKSSTPLSSCLPVGPCLWWAGAMCPAGE